MMYKKSWTRWWIYKCSNQGLCAYLSPPKELQVLVGALHSACQCNHSIILSDESVKPKNHQRTPSKGDINKFLDKWIWSVATRNGLVSRSEIQCTLGCSEMMSSSISSSYNYKLRARLLHAYHVERNMGLTPVVFAFFQTNMQTDNKTICFFILRYKK